MSKLVQTLLASLVLSLSAQAAFATPADGVVDIWPKIPFTRGADLCKYKDAYGQTRTQYMQNMVNLSTQIMSMGGSAYGSPIVTGKQIGRAHV